MKILHILNDLNHSGAEKMLYDASEWFSRHNIHTNILSLVRNGGDGFESELRTKGYTIFHLKFSQNYQFLRELKAFIHKNEFDIVHIHTESAFFWLALVCKLAGTKKICRTVHSNFSFENYLLFKRRLQRRLATTLLKVKYVSISESVCKNELYRLRNNTELINNYINTRHFKKENYTKEQIKKLKAHNNISESSLIITSIGSCSIVKNHKVILNLIKKLKGENIDVQYIHIGEGKLEDEEKLYAKELNIYDSVRFIGNTMKTAEFLAITDIYLMPSIYEGVGIACLEALSMGCFSIVNDTSGLNTLIKGHDNGFLVPDNNLEQYTNLIKKYLKQPDQFKPLISNARAYVCDNYSIEESLKKYLSFYNRL